MDPIELAKEYLSEPRHAIKLDELVVAEIRNAIANTAEKELPLETNSLTADDFMGRLKKYETILKNLQGIAICVAHWGSRERMPTLAKILARLSENLRPRNGSSLLLRLRWYPQLFLCYSVGVAALVKNKYENLETSLLARVQSSDGSPGRHPLVLETGKVFLEVARSNVFKKVAGYERLYNPFSEYLFKTLQPALEDLLYLGNDYEIAFDRFEVFQALLHADVRLQLKQSVWGPPGRFAWKYESAPESSPLKEVMEEAKNYGDSWPPLASGLFGGSLGRFTNASQEYARLIAGLSWH